ncbi:MAG: tetratricopeptide repeat protein [Deltaproteobacteria bacterium]|nr:tetratricopeptide repeat protein [Deltaproteobacteria bacterium]
MIKSLGKKLGIKKKADVKALWREKNEALVAAMKEGRISDAREAAQELLELAESKLSRNDPETATSYCNMGMVLLVEKEHELAEECFREALALRRKIFGPDHKETALIYLNLIELYRQMAQAVLYRTVETTDLKEDQED